MRVERFFVKSEGKERELAKFTEQAHVRIASQRRYLVSHDGDHLAHAVAGGDTLVVHAHRTGRVKRIVVPGLRDFRFTDGSRALVASGKDRQIRLTLGNGIIRKVGDVSGVQWLEPCREGLVLLRDHAGSQRVSLLGWSGSHRELAEATGISRVMAARGGTRIAYVVGHDVVGLDANDPTSRVVGRTQSPVRNGEMAADGSRLVVASDKALYEATGERPLKPIWVEGNVHAVWLDGDDLLAASHRTALFMRGRAKLALPGSGKLANVRFARDGGGGAMLARGRDVLRWRPGKRPEVIASVAPGVTLLGGQVWSGGTLLWTAKRFEVHEDTEFE
jgi:hypothetical protein